jgi:uncharacterized protein YqgC (DUF456 family)
MHRIFSLLNKLDKLLAGFVFGVILPVFFFMLAFIIWFYLDRSEKRILFYVVPGFLAGLILDLKYLKGWTDHRYELSYRFLTVIYMFYNISIFGIFMGFPVFNLIMGVVAGYYMGKRIVCRKIPKENYKGLIKKTTLLASGVMAFICVASAFLALSERDIGNTIRSMSGVTFEITRPMAIAIIAFGGKGIKSRQLKNG